MMLLIGFIAGVVVRHYFYEKIKGLYAKLRAKLPL